jgi:diguanylate cyclase (GGDEF)-like protein
MIDRLNTALPYNFPEQIDALTGLPNRASFLDTLGATPGAVLLLDLDHFKSINDNHGHHVGDQLLIAVARRLRETVSPGTVARLGGDVFAVLLTGVSDPEALEVSTRRVAAALAAPFPIGDDQHVLTVSVGVALEGEDVLGDAEATLHRNKAARGNR